ncbi:MAG: hypothetical protein ABW157_15250 [Candidatus Thiodiazotropha sp. LLP2]|nr:hypothetical protein [Candidatus Thiodiazotropha lotti]MCG8011136.1 hypothetical protein [Candidatus Thiodiazotropha lotti]MCW4210599.1 hypothetical protein [Candidatus Thiodiazotropha lotti]MCW4216807.1 hypothetical protein [Candidatus Thiodiazotropha lotti]
MKADSLWLGFLDAGAKSSPVVRSKQLDTKDPETVFLFNLQRNDILIYKRNIVEPKLRELGVGDMETIRELKKAFKQAMTEFSAREKERTSLPSSK